MSVLQIIENPAKQQWADMLARPSFHSENLEAPVRKILSEVKRRGDRAVDEYSLQFDNIPVMDRMVSVTEFEEAEKKLAERLKSAILQAKENIEAFHRNQLLPEPVMEPAPGIKCWRKSVAIDKVGLYIPGGTAALFSTLIMLGVPARIAGCEEIVVCTPPNPDGSVHAAILFSANILGLRKVFKVGGVQAIAAMAYGTETIPKVYKIFGPGNQYVTHAKKLIQQEGISIDMPAGPSELVVYADETAVPAYVAADLLSQCEHGTDSQVILVTGSRVFAEKVNAELEIQIEKLPRKSIAQKALENSKTFIIADPSVSMELINEYAPEHLILASEDAASLLEKVRNAGSVFIGNFAPESAGDYASGTNHVLPTNGFAKAYSGVSMESFIKKISIQHLTREGLHSIAETVIEMAGAEGLNAHAAAVEIRLLGLKPKA